MRNEDKTFLANLEGPLTQGEFDRLEGIMDEHTETLSELGNDLKEFEKELDELTLKIKKHKETKARLLNKM